MRLPSWLVIRSVSEVVITSKTGIILQVVSLGCAARGLFLVAVGRVSLFQGELLTNTEGREIEALDATLSGLAGLGYGSLILLLAMLFQVLASFLHYSKARALEAINHMDSA